MPAKKNALSWIITNIVPIVTAVVAIAGLLLASISLNISCEANKLASRSINNAEESNKLSHESNNIAEKANQTAGNALKLTYKSYQPIIDGRCITKDDNDGDQTDTIIIFNNGEPVTELVPTIEVFLGIIINKMGEDSSKQITTYIPLYNYFLPWEKANNSKDILITIPGNNGNHTKLESLKSTFFQAATKDYYIPSLFSKNYVRLDFKNKLEEQCVLYYSIDSLAAFKSTPENCAKIHDSAFKDMLSFMNYGITPDIYTLDANKLWTWYKIQYFK